MLTQYHVPTPALVLADFDNIQPGSMIEPIEISQPTIIRVTIASKSGRFGTVSKEVHP